MTSAAGNAHGAGLQPERPLEVAAVDDPIDADAATRTSTPASAPPAQLDSPANHVGQIAPARLPAPLQYRDPARYDILGEHGRGGLGRVFRARDREMGRDVAVKELLNRGAASELRFFREALITARLEHPGIVPVHEAGRWPDGTPFYAMKLVAGRPLKVLFENARTVEARLALLPHILAVADAIAYAHDRKIIHRDLKPANVIVGEFGETVVIDWGLAKDISPEAEDDEPSEAGPYRTAAPTPGVTVAGSVLGTPAYMAPEQARGELVDERADVYAIGAMLFQVCTGEKTPPTDVYKLHHSLGRSGVDVDLVSIVRKACAPEAGGRYRDAGKLAADLRSFTAGARVLARHYSAGALVSHWVKRHKRLAAAVAAVAAVIAAVAVVAFVTITGSRNRARQAKAAAEAESARALESETRERVAHATQLAPDDPTAAYHLLDEATGSLEVALLRARAAGRNIAERQVPIDGYVSGIAMRDGAGEVYITTRDRRILLARIADGSIREIGNDLAEPDALACSQSLCAWATQRNGHYYVANSQGQVVAVPQQPRRLAPLAHEVLLETVGRSLYSLDLRNHRISLLADDVARLIAATSASDWLECSANGDVIAHQSGQVSVISSCAESLPVGNTALDGLRLVPAQQGYSVFHGAREEGSPVATDLKIAAYAVSGDGHAAVVAGGRSFVITPTGTVEPGLAIQAYAQVPVARGSLLAWSHVGGRVMVLDTATKEAWAIQAGAEAPQVAIDSAGRRVLTAEGRVLRIWRIPPPTMPIARVPCAPFHLVKSPHVPTYFACDCQDGTAWLFDIAAGSVRRLHAHAQLSYGIAWRGDEVCSGGWDGRVLCTSISSGETIEAASTGSAVRAIASDGKTLLFGTADGWLWQRSAGKTARDRIATHLGHASDEPSRILLSESSILVGTRSGCLESFGRDGTVNWTKCAHRGQVSSVVRAQDNATVSAGWDGEVLRWQDSKPQRLDHVRGGVRELVPLADGYVASVDYQRLRIVTATGIDDVDLRVSIERTQAYKKGAVAGLRSGEVVFFDMSNHVIRALSLDDGAVAALADASTDSDFAVLVVTETGDIYRIPERSASSPQTWREHHEEERIQWP